ncbi:MAG: single-stranded-DNA-specific exonuclease RecJ [Clostridia bacterium]|nr:single-stranded-DNA-specific exonuclease RecJ [Clostridia bacterium]
MSKLKKWSIRHVDREDGSAASAIVSELGIGEILADILVQRGYKTPQAAKAFLGKETSLFHDAFLMNDMRQAVDRIFTAIDNREHITIYGDYDVDGVTSVSALYLYLSEKGALVDCYIPNRSTEGYGMNLTAIDKLAENGTKLIITVDTGITAIEEAKYLKEKGLEMIVTDHHRCQAELPEAIAVINPKRPDNTYPFDELAGVGVVFKLLCALEQTYCERISHGSAEDGTYLMNVCRDYCDLVAIGTIADVMPLTDENRLICAVGLNQIERSPRPGLNALIEQTSENKGLRNGKPSKKRKITASYIGYTIAPKINAAGRISDAMDGVRLFLADTRAEATKIAERLFELNTLRQAEENRIASEAIEQAEKTHDFEHDPVLVLASEHWHHGVIGIVASRLTERYNLPTLLISIEDGIGKGSGRSIKGLNLTEALTACSDSLIRYGGHELAAGLTVAADKIDEFRVILNDYARNRLSAEDTVPVLEIDRETEDEDITLTLAEQMNMLEPCGVNNPYPMLLRRNAQIADIVSIGVGGKHTKLTLRSATKPKTALIFGTPMCETDFTVGDTVDVVYQPDINDFQNVRSVQMLVRDARLCEAELCLYEKEMALYNAVVNEGERFFAHDRLLPSREDFATVYTALKKLCAESDTFGIHKLFCTVKAMNPTQLPPMRMAKLKLCLTVLSDVGLISLELLPNPALCGTELYKIHLCQVNGKVNLEGAPRYKAIKSRLKKTPVSAEQ